MTARTAERLGAVELSGLALVRLVDPHDVRALAKYAKAGEVVMPFRAPRVRNLKFVGGMPGVLAAFVALLGLLAIGHGLWRSTRARRREFVVLATIGFRPRDLRAVVLWQATCIATIGIAFGVPAGFLVGRAAWSAVADATGVVDEFVFPVVVTALVAAATLGFANLVGVVAARWVTRIRPSMALRE